MSAYSEKKGRTQGNQGVRTYVEAEMTLDIHEGDNIFGREGLDIRRMLVEVVVVVHLDEGADRKDRL